MPISRSRDRSRAPTPPGGIALASARLDLSAGFDLPGVTAKAQRFGVDVAVSFSLTRNGNLLGRYLLIEPPTPRAPEVIAISLAGPLPGGGYLEHSPETNTYRGAIGVDLGFVVVAGFASISPGDPVSVVALLSASFRPPIQLSFGFTLVGVGGVVGINRSINRDALQEATFSGALGSMFFPRDPVAEAPSILPALDRCFPVSPGDFFAGPMLKVGWGTPTIVSATIAVIAGTSGVAIFGRFAVSLPCEDVPFAVLQATVVGFIDAQGVSVFGSLVNSHVGPITIDGDACFVLTGGDNGTMALSVGGFHPQYKERPAGIKPMKRLRAELSPLPFASISIEGYCAVTSDSVQFGASIRMSCDLAVAAVEGSASFDALIYFSPFRFMVDFRGVAQPRGARRPVLLDRPGRPHQRTRTLADLRRGHRRHPVVGRRRADRAGVGRRTARAAGDRAPARTAQARGGQARELVARRQR